MPRSKKKQPARDTVICIGSARRRAAAKNPESSVDWLRDSFSRGELTPEQIAQVEATIPGWTWDTPKPKRKMAKVLMFPIRAA